MRAGSDDVIKVYTSSVIDGSADAVWAHVRDFNGLPKWTPFVAESRIEGGLPADKIGCVRHFRLKDGGIIREQLLTLSDYDYQCSYSILESPMGVDNYVATLKLTPVTDGGRTFAEWWAEFDCRAGARGELAQLVGQQVFQAALRQPEGGVPAVIRVVRSAVIDAPIGDVWAILRDFNSHTAWHPVVADSHIERGEASDQVGCVRNFTLRDGNHIREQLLTLSDRDHVSTYCILDATLPCAATSPPCTLKRVTDGDRTFWHWESTFDVPRGRERSSRNSWAAGSTKEASRDCAPICGGAARRRVRGATAVPMAARGIVVARHGGPEVLQPATLQAPSPGPDEVRVRHHAIGVNYIDVYVRTGLYPLLQPPAVPGMEAAGIVLDVGEGVHHLLRGDRVAYACPPPGAYVDVRTMAADQVVALPDDIDDETAAASMLKGMTAEYLLHRTHRVRAGDTVLVHAAAGGVGLFLCAWAKALGARVLGTVSSAEKARIAREHGCDVVIVTREPRFAAAVRDASGGRGADVIYDGLGAPARDENIAALAMCGHWIVYGQAGGAHAALDADVLADEVRHAVAARPVPLHGTASAARVDRAQSLCRTAQRHGAAAHRTPLSVDGGGGRTPRP